MGYAGSYTKYRVNRITGLDPARPAFEDCIGPENHLDDTDANFVDVIHSCAGYLGFRKPIGMVDFYPNGGGPPQPGCKELSQIFSRISISEIFLLITNNRVFQLAAVTDDPMNIMRNLSTRQKDFTVFPVQDLMN